MAVKKGGLGKGLDSLIPSGAPKNKKNITEEKKQPVKVVEKVVEKIVEKPVEMKMKITEVEPNREQPRKNFDEDALLELAESIKQFGVLQPLLVQKKDDYYEIIAGERRWRAAKLAGLKEVPVIIKDFSDQEVVEISLIENIQRENLNPIEEAAAYKRLLTEFNLKQEEVAERVSKSRTAVTNSMRLLKLDERVQDMLIQDMISPGHARTLLGIEDKDQQYNLAMRIFDEKLSVRDTEKIVKDLQKPKKEEKKNSKESVDDVKMTEKDADAAKTAGAEDDGTQAQKENTDAENPKEASQSSESQSADGIDTKKKDAKDALIEELQDKVKRQMAEFDNFRKRTEKEKSSMFEMGASDMIKKLLPIVDNFERGFNSISEEERETPFAKGMDMVYKQTMKMLEDSDVKPIEALGMEFNPELHNAVMHVEDDSVGEGIIVEEFEKGYTYRETVIRHSMVKVAN